MKELFHGITREVGARPKFSCLPLKKLIINRQVLEEKEKLHYSGGLWPGKMVDQCPDTVSMLAVRRQKL